MMRYVQETAFLNDLGRGVLAVLGASGFEQVLEAFETAKEQSTLKILFKQFVTSEYEVLEPTTVQNDRIAYIGFQKALGQLQWFTKDCDYYNTFQKKQNRFLQLQESVSKIEADMLYRIITECYDKESVKRYLGIIDTPLEVVDMPVKRRGRPPKQNVEEV